MDRDTAMVQPRVRLQIAGSIECVLSITNTRIIIMSGKALKSQISDTMLNGEQLSSETDHSNFADFKPGRPESYKIEFKKSRETLEMKGEV